MQDEAGTTLTPPTDPAADGGAADGAPDDASGARLRPRTRATLAPFAVLALVTLGLDQASKVWALGSLDDGHVVPLVGDVLRLRLIRNPGAAFSIGDSSTVVMTALAVAITIAVVVAAWRAASPCWTAALGLLLGGSLGNLSDRFFREPGPGRGHVIDFIDYGGLFVGNVADIAIVLGAVVVVWLTFTGVGLDGVRAGRHARDEDTDDAEDDTQETPAAEPAQEQTKGERDA